MILNTVIANSYNCESSIVHIAILLDTAVKTVTYTLFNINALLRVLNASL